MSDQYRTIREIPTEAEFQIIYEYTLKEVLKTLGQILKTLEQIQKTVEH